MYEIILEYYDIDPDTGERGANRHSVHLTGTTVNTTVLDPSVDLALNKAGRAEFTVPASHPYYSKITPMSSNVYIYEINDLGIETNIFYGRVSTVSIGWNNQKRIICEGALAYFNDSVQTYKKYPSKTTTLEQFFEAVLEKHSEQMNDNTRKFEKGTMELYDPTSQSGETINNKKVYRLTNYETTLEVLETMCLESEGGYMFARVVEDGGVKINKLDWISKLDTDINQPAKFGLNLTDLNQDFEPDELYTALMPLGANYDKFTKIVASSGDNPAENGWYIQTEDPETHELGYEAATETVADLTKGYYEKSERPLTIKNATGNTDHKLYIENERASNKYGFILQTKRWDDINDKNKLYKKAQEWMASERFDKLVINCDLADLSVLDSAWDPLILGKIVRIISPPHGITEDNPIRLPISEIHYDLNTGKKQVTVGTQPQVTLTRITKKGKTKEVRIPDAKYDYEDDTN